MSAQMEEEKEHEFDMSDKDFNTIREFVKEHTGISLSEGKRNMVYGRLSRRLRQLKLTSFSHYLEYVNDASSDEMGNFVNAITTNLTSFFREPHHFEYLKTVVIPHLLKANEYTKQLRIWSSGCSTGEEPYSLAITVLESVPRPELWDIKILATDLDTNVIAHAERGVYDEERIKGMPESQKRKWFMRGKGANAGSARVSSALRDLITFRKLNLMEGWPMKGPFDFMFCRNVVIYFDKDTQKILFDRYANLIRPDGHLFLGHSESLFKVSDRFQLIGNTIYQRTK